MTNMILQPWYLLVFILAGMVNREQQQTIEYLCTENQALKEKLGKKRIMLNDDQRRQLAVEGEILGRKALENIAMGENFPTKYWNHFCLARSAIS